MSHTSPTDGSRSEHLDAGPLSHCAVTLLEGRSVAYWTCPRADVADRTAVNELPGAFAELALCLAPERLVVVGRSTGRSPVPYLDPAYRATPVLPDTQQTVLMGDDHTDGWVSRAHFTLRGAADGGVVFTNGVPGAGGGVRPPTNGTWLVAPAVRALGPGEEVRIGCGETVTIRLPNHCVLQLKAR
ncbi:hypothetical protein [Frigoriglobus tundricola]|uniref:Uncharacterized protein n=1 Tax=Frigoriglobus tundricola TaxID=2774151 RepID=A0A6M5YR56_9BACT|nr:hypothetical protein [Frigoriglobus tundricola]QJW95910.1 hypothetical protein FTUN_3464 [Frigoriglobus tundricola]